MPPFTVETIKENIKALAPEQQRELREWLDTQKIAAPIAESEPAPPEKNITEVLMELYKDIPPEERGKLPTDLSENLDHYIYGWPKK